MCAKKGKRMWFLYHSLEIRGEIFTIKGNKRIFITSHDYIYIYNIDETSAKPILQNVFGNYMQCTSVLLSSQGERYIITYKRQEQGFQIYRKKFFHNFRTPILQENFENAKGLDIEALDSIIIANSAEI